MSLEHMVSALMIEMSSPTPLVNEELESEVGDPTIDPNSALKDMPTPSKSSRIDIDSASPVIITRNMNCENYPNQQSAEPGPSSVSSTHPIDLAPEHESEANTSQSMRQSKN